MEKVKRTRARRRGYSRVSAKHQVTLPVDALGEAGLRPGDVVRVRAEGPGRVVLTRERNPLDEYAGAMTGAFVRPGLDELRDEWR